MGSTASSQPKAGTKRLLNSQASRSLSDEGQAGEGDAQAVAGGTSGVSVAQRASYSFACEVITPFVVTPGKLVLGPDAEGRGRGGGSMTFRPSSGTSSDTQVEDRGLAGGSSGAADSYSWALRPMAPRQWPLTDLRSIHFRHYLQQPTALELFFHDRSSLLLNLKTRKAAREAEQVLRRVFAPAYLAPSLGSTPKEVGQHVIA